MDKLCKEVFLIIFSKRKFFVILIVASIVIAIICISSFLLVTSKKQIQILDLAQSASYVKIFDGSTGKHVLIDEVDEVKYIATDLSNIIYNRTARKGDTDGFWYSVSIFDSQNKLLWKGTINGENSVVIEKNVYTPSKKIDINYIKDIVSSNS